MPQIPVTMRSAEDRPLVKVVNDLIPNPAAGTAFSIVVPQGYRFNLVALYLQFVTDANVANRFITVTVTTPSGTIFTYSHTTPIVAGETRTLCIGSGIANLTWTATLMNATAPFPPALTLEEGCAITITVAGIQVGDQFSLINSQVLSQFAAE